jgi:hypothetical protein
MLTTVNRADGMSVRRIGGDHYDHHHPKAIDGIQSPQSAEVCSDRGTDDPHTDCGHRLWVASWPNTGDRRGDNRDPHCRAGTHAGADS